jgi:hypothetical protein
VISAGGEYKEEIFGLWISGGTFLYLLSISRVGDKSA